MFRALYKKLLTLYPRPFRERFGESMAQTFDDLCRENDGRWLSLILRLSIDTGIGIVKERVLHCSRRRNMAAILTNPKIAALVGILLFLPGISMLTLMMLGIEPSFGPLDSYLQSPGGSHVLGSLVVLFAILVLPTAGVMINTQGETLKQTLATAAPSALFGAVAVLPFVALQSMYGSLSYSSLPVALFTVLWLMPTLIAFAGLPVCRDVLAGKSIAAKPFALFLRFLFVAVITVMWVGLVKDQLPCFLGVPNCD